MIEINKKDLTNPTESGWYLCKYKNGSVAYFKDDEDRSIDYYLCHCNPVLLYWEQNLWLPSPRSFKVIDNNDVLSWCKVPDEYNIYDEDIKLKY